MSKKHGYGSKGGSRKDRSTIQKGKYSHRTKNSNNKKRHSHTARGGR